jgi:hypothetical protein
MSRKTLPLTVILLMAGAAAVTGCAGTDTDGEGRKPPEICNNEIDDDDDGLVDCDDELECGGLQCETDTTDTDIVVELDPAEILFDPTSCCDFTFSQGDCPMMIGTYQAANREEEIDGELDASCNLIGGEPPLSFSVAGCPNCPIPYLVNQPVDPNTTVTVEVWFDCAVAQTFEATCLTEIDVNPYTDDREFTVTGTRVDP